MNVHVDVKKSQDVVSSLRQDMRQCLVLFFERAGRHATYRHLLNVEYSEIDAEGLEGKVRNAARRNARERLRDREDLEPKPVSMVIRTPAGSGKTYSMVEAFNQVKPGAVDLFMPTSRLCGEFVDQYKSSTDFEQEFPRNGDDPDFHMVDRLHFDHDDLAAVEEARNKGMQGIRCPRHRKAEILGNAGSSIRGLLCHGCNLKSSCGYMRQRPDLQNALERGAMIVRPHVRLWAGSLVDPSHIKVIDEDCISNSLKSKELRINDLTQSSIISAVVPSPSNADFLFEAARLIEDFVTKFQAAPTRPVNHMVQSISEIKKMPFCLAKRIQSIEGRLQPHELSANQLEKTVKEERVKFLRTLKDFCNQIITCWKMGCPLATASAGKSVISFFHVDMPNLKKENSLLIMDATFNPTFASIVFDRKFEDPLAEDRVDMNVEVSVVNMTASQQQLDSLKRKMDQAERNSVRMKNKALIDAAKAFIGPQKKVLVVSNKKVGASFQNVGLPEGWDQTNFGMARGLNKWEEFDGALIVGQTLPSCTIIERQAAAFGLLTGDTIQTVEAWQAQQGMEPRKKSLLPIDDSGRYFHPCPIVWSFIKTKVHDEYLQAIGRLRAVGSTHRKKVLLVSSFMPEALAEYVTKTTATMEWDGLAAWPKLICQCIADFGFGLQSPSFLAQIYNLRQKKIERQKSLYDSEGLREVVTKFLSGEIKNSPPIKLLENKEVFDDKNMLLNLFTLPTADGVKDPPLSINNNIYIEGGGSLTSWGRVKWGRTGQPCDIFLLSGSYRGLDLAKASWWSAEREVPYIKPLPVEHPKADKLMVLECREGKSAAKAFEPMPSGRYREVQEYDAGHAFMPLEIDVGTPGGLYRALDGLQGDVSRFVIRGAVRGGLGPAIVQRTSRDRGDRKAFFEDVPKNWIMIDVDEFVLPMGLDALDDDPAYLAQLAILSLPEPFRSSTATVCLSASCGLKDRSKFKFHAWFYLEEALNSSQAKRWLSSLGERKGKTQMYWLGDCLVDLSVLSPVQPHYTANPIIHGPDPYPQRVFFIEGDEEMIKAEIPEIRVAEREIVPVDLIKSDVNAVVKLQLALAEIGDGLRGFNEGVKYAAMKAVAAMANSDMQSHDVVAMISNAVLSANPGDRSHDEITRYASTDFIKDKIQWWIDIQNKN